MVDIQLLEIDPYKKYLILVKVNNTSTEVASNIEEGLVFTLARLGVSKNNVGVMIMHDLEIEINHAE